MGEGGKDVVLAQEQAYDLFYGAPIGSCQGHDLALSISSYRENGGTFSHVSWLTLPCR